MPKRGEIWSYAFLLLQVGVCNHPVYVQLSTEPRTPSNDQPFVPVGTGNFTAALIQADSGVFVSLAANSLGWHF